MPREPDVLNKILKNLPCIIFPEGHLEDLINWCVDNNIYWSGNKRTKEEMFRIFRQNHYFSSYDSVAIYTRSTFYLAKSDKQDDFRSRFSYSDIVSEAKPIDFNDFEDILNV